MAGSVNSSRTCPLYLVCEPCPFDPPLMGMCIAKVKGSKYTVLGSVYMETFSVESVVIFSVYMYYLHIINCIVV